MLSANQILKTFFGYDSFRPLQEKIINHVVAGKDALVLMPTGGGKSLCYQIPSLMMEGTTVVISPLISLMKDQVDALCANGIAARALNSGNDESANQAIMDMCEAGNVNILYISPERFVTEIPWFQQYVKVSLIAIDEAHCISEWGHDFRPEYTQLDRLHEQFPCTPVLALTATADKITEKDIVEQLKLVEPEIFVSSFDRPNLSLDVRRGYSSREKLIAILEVIHRHKGESGIIYCLSRKGAENLAEKLKAKGVSVGVYHAGLSGAERIKIQEDFINDRVDVVCATIAFGMGIDKSNVRFVIHNNLPKSIESFYQEIGRGGRDGLDTETILFYSLQDIITLRKFADESGQRDMNLEKLNRMQEYAEAQVCRRRILLNYFGETSDCQCGNYDVCKTPPERFDGTVIVQKALSAIKRTNEQVGFVMVTDILRGSLTSDVANRGFNKLKTFGAGRDISARDWHDYLLQMLQMGFVEIAYNEDKHLKITSLGENVLYGRHNAQLAVIVHEDYRAKRRKNESEQTVKAKIELNPDKSLFAKLKELRLVVANEKNKPAFTILSDKSLLHIASKKPTTLEDFGDCFGIGEYKKRTLGNRFVALIREYLEMTPISDDAPQIQSENLSYMEQQKQLYSNAYAPWTKEDDVNLFSLYNKGYSIEELVNVFGRNKGAIRSRIKKLGLF